MRDRTLLGLSVAAAAGLGYLLVRLPGLQRAIGDVATSIVRPLVLPLIELINVPAFVYCAALAILVAGLVACLVHRFRSVAPRLAEMKAINGSISELPVPRLQGAVRLQDWAQARQRLGSVLMTNSSFVSPWTLFQAESVRSQGVPSRPFSSFVAAEPERRGGADELMHSLPGYFTSIGLIFTFVGLVVALYFAAKGFRTGDIAEARAAIIQLLNAASFKFLTSVSALISALLVSLYARYAGTLVRQQRLRTLERIEIYLANWREKIGTGRPEQRLEPSDLLRRFDDLLSSVATLSSDMKLMLERRGAVAAEASSTEFGGEHVVD